VLRWKPAPAVELAAEEALVAAMRAAAQEASSLEAREDPEGVRASWPEALMGPQTAAVSEPMSAGRGRPVPEVHRS
jgi:hypothetical protein